mmetsp:Transcript_13971/g.15914  ORF Transcript_13971/g.15914 Transcript_13971/m.15914 type:complete len:181 (+) Transcript_13971:99-641(+)
MITAFSSVFNARMLQKGDLPLNVQNALLYSQGFVFNLIAYNLGFTPSKVTGFFTGYDDINVMLVLLSQSLMGIAISLVYKYGGAVVKTLATGAQAALLTIADGMFFGVPLGPGRISGAVTVFVASHLYFTVALKEKSSGEYNEAEANKCQYARRLVGALALLSLLLASSIVFTYGQTASP